MKTGLTLSELAQQMEALSERKHDLVVPCKRLGMEATGDGVQFLVDGGPSDLQQHAHQQLGGILGIPAAYYSRMLQEQPKLLADNVNTWLDSRNDRRMVRQYLPHGDGQVLTRAILSDRYKRIDHDDVLLASMPMLQEAGKEYGLQVASSQVTDRSLYLKVSYPKLTGEVAKGDVVQMGIVVRNSEVGSGSFSVTPYLVRLACLNGMVVQTDAKRRAHVGRQVEEDGVVNWQDDTRRADDRLLQLQMRDAIRAMLQPATIHKLCDDMRQTTERRLEGDVVEAVEVLAKRSGLRQEEKSLALRHLIEGADLTQWGLANAVTRTAEDVDDYDRATELESLGWDVVKISANDWQASYQQAAR